MKRFNPTAPTKVAIGEGLICQQAGRSVFNKLAAGADLAPGSQQLVVGGIGSGKTTELLLAGRELSAHEHTRPVYIDVAAETDLNSVNSGALLASLGLRVWSEIVSKFEPPDELKKVYEAIKNAAYGYEKTVWEPGPEPDFNQYEPGNETDLEPGYYRTITFRGKLKPPFPALLRDVRDLGNSLSKLAAFLKTKQIELVAIFDGLDRLIKNISRFRSWSRGRSRSCMGRAGRSRTTSTKSITWRPPSRIQRRRHSYSMFSASAAPKNSWIQQAWNDCVLHREEFYGI
ncbi:MAG: hypothetical protein HYR60_07270 [Acidobacteria bacterium]|nr:hypothetical protein [Acidobacteriota bacterium]